MSLGKPQVSCVSNTPYLVVLGMTVNYIQQGSDSKDMSS